MNLQPNSIFAGRYRLIKQIGRGGFSVVWLVADQMTEDTEMALKIYAPDKGMDEGGLKMFRREYTVTAKLNHNGLLKASHFDIHDGSPYLVMPFCEKGSLQALLMEKGTLPEKEIARILAQTAAALEYLHIEDILHQDIKPDNVLIDNKGNYLLTDFGISSRLRSTLRKSTNTGKAMTVAYAPPERFGAKQESLTAGDIFSLGVMIYELCFGDVPWMGAGGAVLRADSELPELPEGYSEGLEQLMQQCLRFVPSQRFTAAQLKRAAEEYLKTGQWPAAQKPTGGGGRKTEPKTGRKTEPIAGAAEQSRSNESPKLGPEPKPKNKKSPLPLILGVLLMLMLSGGSYYHWHSEQEKARLACEETLQQAAEQMEAKDFRQALSGYRQSQDCCMDNCPMAQAGEKTALDSLQARYDGLIAQGDALLEQGNFEEARSRYQEAGQWQLEGKKPEDKLAEVKKKEAERLKNSVTDIDGNRYKIVKIGNQIWMAENLRTSRYRNGDRIPNVTSTKQWNNLTSGAWVHFDNDSKYENPYGKLYNWYAVADNRSICPTGWHVPTDEEWGVLINYLDGEVAGGKMKSRGTQYWWTPNENATNSSGFSGLPGGFRLSSGLFVPVGSYGYWWSSTEDGTASAWNRGLFYDGGNVIRLDYDKTIGFSVRCLRD